MGRGVLSLPCGMENSDFFFNTLEMRVLRISLGNTVRAKRQIWPVAPKVLLQFPHHCQDMYIYLLTLAVLFGIKPKSTTYYLWILSYYMLNSFKPQISSLLVRHHNNSYHIRLFWWLNVIICTKYLGQSSFTISM